MMFTVAAAATTAAGGWDVAHGRGQLKCGKRNGNLVCPSVLVAYCHNNSVLFSLYILSFTFAQCERR